MMKTNLFVFAFLSLTSAVVTFDMSLRCSCEELNQAECQSLLMIFFCKWTTSCTSQDLNLHPNCSNLAQVECTAKNSYYYCGWSNGSCTDKNYSCSDFSDRDSCPTELGLDCYWNKNNKCDSFSKCDDYDAYNCKHYGCYLKGEEVCTEFKCSDFTVENECGGQDSQTTICSWSNDGKCDSISTTSTCTDVSNYKLLCESNENCVYENSSCRFVTCKDIKNSFSCIAAQTGEKELTLCQWKETQCIDAADTTKLTQNDCFTTSSFNYRWSSENKCVECSNLVSLNSSQYILSLIFGILSLLI